MDNTSFLTSQKYIDLKPVAGLCNRLRAIFSYRKKAIEEDAILNVYWTDHSHCAGNIFNTIIDLPSHINYQYFSNSYGNDYVHRLPGEYNQCCIPDYQCLKLKNNFKKLYLDIIEKLFQNKQYIAVHIRRTDFTIDAVKNGHYMDDTYFYNYIDSVLEKSPETLVFLATDNPTTQLQFISKYSQNIRILHKIPETLNRETLRFTNIEWAFLDICVCVNANDFFGTPKSSFSETIQLMREQSVNYLW
jgi:hypothetical protein